MHLTTPAIAVSCLALLATIQGNAQEKNPTGIEATRAAAQQRWSKEGIVKPSEVDQKAKLLLTLPLEKQSDTKLRELATKANAAANLVGYIAEGYEGYYRTNYRYDFIRKKVSPYQDAYNKIGNRMKSYRNQCYFNLGMNAAARGDHMAAFFLFRDAYRLSTFTESKGDHKGIRYKAEIEMKKLLGLEGLGTYVYWQ